MKQCPKCGKTKDFSEFYAIAGGKTKQKYMSHCRECLKTKNKGRKRSGKRKLVADMSPEEYKRYRDKRNANFKKRYHNDLDFRIKKNLRERMRKALKGMSKTETTQNLLGCSEEEFKAHIASQFKEGMSWENYGYNGWHIDHIKPLDAFDLSDPEEQKEAFHYSNLQPLWSADNLSKGSDWGQAATTTA
jgi:hypothetical protein